MAKTAPALPATGCFHGDTLLAFGKFCEIMIMIMIFIIIIIIIIRCARNGESQTKVSKQRERALSSSRDRGRQINRGLDLHEKVNRSR